MHDGHAPLVVIDDDPTGFQALHRGEVIFDVTSPLPLECMIEPGAVTFVLANTRSMNATQAEALYRRISEQLASTGASLTLVSRGDSTLRGHTYLESSTVQEAFTAQGRGFDAVILVMSEEKFTSFGWTLSSETTVPPSDL